jgi:acetylornithine deacetylase/succinyl-diaminopimelate desuccinylase-like protein
MTSPAPAPDPAAKRRRHRNERIAATLFVLAAAAGVVWFIRWNAVEQERFRRERTYIPRTAVMTPEIRLLQDFVRTDSSNPPGNEVAAADWVMRLLAKNGVHAELIESAPGRRNVYARIRGSRTGEGLLLFQHLDVVPADGAGWEHRPFSGDIERNELYGRGAVDMKSIGLTHLLAFIEVARSGRAPERDVVFLAVADEETGSTYGMQWILAHRPDVIAGVRYAIGEGGVNEMTAEHMVYFGIEVGGKQYTRVRVAAATMEALVQARQKLQRYTVRREPERILPEVRAFFRDSAPTRFHYRPLLADIDAAVRDGKFWELPPAYRELTYNIVAMPWPTRSANGGYEGEVEMGNLQDEPTEARLAWLASQLEPLGVRIVDVPTRGFPVPSSSSDTPLFRLIADQARRRYQTTAGTLVLNRSSNDARFLRLRGIICYGVLPFPLDIFQSRAIHGTNERIRLDWFMDGVDFMHELVDSYAFEPAVT